MKADIVLHNIKTLYTPIHQDLPVRGKKMQDILCLENAYIAVHQDQIVGVGEGDYAKYVGQNTRLHDAKGMICVPGFVDSHTHLVHAGSREHEFERKLKGVPYLTILKEGGGILSSVNATKEASFDALTAQALKSLDRFLQCGVTTLEAKSGYGLDLETELKQLRVAKHLNSIHPIDIVSTFMGAHAFPPKYQDDHKGYIKEIFAMLDMVKDYDLAQFVDVFCEEGVFNHDQSKRILLEAKKKGFLVKIHADEIHNTQGAELAHEVGAVSADHLIAISEAGIQALKQSNTIANLLPGTSFYLDKPFAPAKAMLHENIALAVSSDYNPGSHPSENYLLVLALACLKYKLHPYTVLTAATLNGAHAVDLGGKVGSITKGKQADFVLLDAPNWHYVLYHYGINHVTHVYKNGQLVIKNQRRTS